MICDFFDTARSHGRPVVISKLFKMHQLLMRRVARTPYSKPDTMALYRARPLQQRPDDFAVLRPLQRRALPG